jgi:hypothetical protein
VLHARVVADLVPGPETLGSNYECNSASHLGYYFFFFSFFLSGWFLFPFFPFSQPPFFSLQTRTCLHRALT